MSVHPKTKACGHLRSTCSQEPSYQPPVGPGEAAADSPDAMDRTAILSPSLKG